MSASTCLERSDDRGAPHDLVALRVPRCVVGPRLGPRIEIGPVDCIAVAADQTPEGSVGYRRWGANGPRSFGAAEVGDRNADLCTRGEADVIDQLVTIHHPVVGGELHGQAIDQRGQAHCRRIRIRTGEFAGLHPGADDPRHELGGLLVELLADLLHHRVAQRLAPTVDPQHPFDVVAALGHVVLYHPFELAEGGRSVLDLALHLGHVLVGVVGERLGEQLLLRIEVVVDQAARHLESFGNIGNSGAGKASLDDDFARRLEDLVAPFGNCWLLHCAERYRCHHPSGSAPNGSRIPVRPVGCSPIASCSRIPIPISTDPSGAT